MTKRTLEKAVPSGEAKPPKAGFHRKALVIGGGIAGIRAALEIAKAGFPVVLVERKPSIGGHMAQLAEVFPTMNSAARILTPLMHKVGHHPNIRLLTLSEVVDIKGCLGNFHIRIRKNPRYVVPEKCDLCEGHSVAQCVKVCPVTVPSQFDEGLALTKAIYIPFSHAVPATYTINKEVCISCGMCARPDVCGPGAINLADEGETVDEDVGVVIVSTGYELYAQENLGKYGVNEGLDVITSLQFERLLSSEGPTGGVPKRLSDGKIPKKVAFIHCAGSRDEKHVPYCSNLCCTNLAKQAILYIRLVPDGEAHCFYTDLLAEGEISKDFIKRAQEEPCVNYIRAEVSKIHEVDRKVKILYAESQQRKKMEMTVDMAVLALPMVPSSGVKDLADQMRIQVDEHGFLRGKHPNLCSVESAASGVFIAGCAQAPMDIQSAMAQAVEAARKALEVLTQRQRTR